MPYFTPIRQDEYPATDELQCIAVHIPAGDEYKALLAGFIAMLCRADSYQDPDSAQADGIAAVFDEGYAQTNWDGCGVPPECEMSTTESLITMDEVSITSGNPMTYAVNANSMYGGIWRQNPAASADQWRIERYLAAGEWSYEMMYLRNTDAGKMNFYITQDFGSYALNQAIDFYGTTLFNARLTNSFTIPHAGKWVIGFDGTGKNASSSNFFRNVVKIVLFKHDDL